MASISSLNGGSSSSSIYGSRNVISGLASGIDTEALIQNAVSGYEMKISNLNQKRTKMEWQQEALRSIITKMVSFSDKFTSYTSPTNLMSASFFNNTVKVSTLGANKDKVSASGKTSSDVKLLGVEQLATSASYTVSGGVLGGGSDSPAVEGEELDLTQKYDKSLITGTLTLGAGSAKVTISFDEDDICENGEQLADKINEKLKEQTISFGKNGTSSSADKELKAEWDAENNSIKFVNVGSAGNGAYVLGATGDMKSTLGIVSSTTKDNVTAIEVGADKQLVDKEATYADMLKEKEFSFTLDGKTKKISLKEYDFSQTSVEDALQTELDYAFGKDKIQVGTNDAGGLKFEVDKGSTLKIDGGKALKLASDSETSYANTSKKLGELLGDFGWEDLGTAIEAKGAVTEVPAANGKDAYFEDSEGNRVKKFGEGADAKYYRVDDKDNLLHALEINGKQIGAFSKETALETVMTTINGNADANVSLSYSQTTNQFKFAARESGEAGNIRIENDGGLASKLFGYTVNDDGSYVDGYVQGQDAKVKVSVNGERLDLVRSGNSFEIDGLTINVKEAFGFSEPTKEVGKVVEGKNLYNIGENNTNLDENGYLLGADGSPVSNKYNPAIKPAYVDEEGYYVNSNGVRYKDDAGNFYQGEAAMTKAELIEGTEAVTFESSADADTIVDAVKTMVEDYNAMVKEIKNAYSTLPMQTSKGKYYEPLTEADREGMSESAIKAHEEKAKTGLLFADRDLSSLYTRLTNAVQSVGGDLESIGISVAYDNGLTTLSLNESKLRDTLASDPNKVQTVFTRSKGNGAATDGLMQALKAPLDTYAKTTGATKGLLIEKAGSVLAPTSIYQNTIQRQMDALDDQISSWQDKLSDKVDYYTSKFTQLEVLVNQMNSQSSALAGMTGGF